MVYLVCVVFQTEISQLQQEMVDLQQKILREKVSEGERCFEISPHLQILDCVNYRCRTVYMAVSDYCVNCPHIGVSMSGWCVSTGAGKDESNR